MGVGRSGTGGIDTVASEVLQHRLAMVAEEGGIRASRSAGSAFVSQGHSCACALFTSDGSLIAQTSSGQHHVSALRYMTAAVIAEHPTGTMLEGDAFICNDQFRGGIHPTDLAAFRPVFCNGEVVFIAAILMVVSDMGGISSGSLPANASEVFHEGLVIPPSRIVATGVLNRELMGIILANSRVPDKLRTDIEALIGACEIVDRRLRELLAVHGRDRLLLAVAQLIDHSEKMVRDGISAIPDGEYAASYFAENDGVGPQERFEVRVRIVIRGSGCLFDFSGSADQAQGAINCSFSQSMSFVAFAIRCHLDPHIAMNEGFYRPIAVEFPPGSVTNPNFPAACNLRFAIGQAMVDAIHLALLPVFPDRSVAPSSAIATVNASGMATGRERMWSAFDVTFGPGGGRSGADANDGLPFPMIGAAGYMRNVEALEQSYPMRYHRYAIHPDSAGPGEWRGGAGMIKEIEFLEDSRLTLRATDRTVFPPRGMAGGEPGRGGGWTINPGREDARHPPPKSTNYPVRKGDVLRIAVAGGGGFGDPSRRAPARLAEDYAAGIVTLRGAREDYGVVLDPITGEVDAQATGKLRAQRSEGTRSHVA